MLTEAFHGGLGFCKNGADSFLSVAVAKEKHSERSRTGIFQNMTFDLFSQAAGTIRCIFGRMWQSKVVSEFGQSLAANTAYCGTQDTGVTDEHITKKVMNQIKVHDGASLGVR